MKEINRLNVCCDTHVAPNLIFVLNSFSIELL